MDNEDYKTDCKLRNYSNQAEQVDAYVSKLRDLVPKDKRKKNPYWKCLVGEL